MQSNHLVSTKQDYHVHCNYNDHSAADLTVNNVVKRAVEMGLESVAFTEHVRKNSEWTPKYLEELSQVKSQVKIIPGFEAKILRDGSVDCRQDLCEKYFIIAS